MTGSLATDDQIRDLLTDSRLWFVVGLGDNPGRPAYGMARFLLDLGKTVVPFADDAIDVGAAAVWFQLNVIDVDAAQRVMDSGMLMVMDRCPAIDYPRLVT